MIADWKYKKGLRYEYPVGLMEGMTPPPGYQWAYRNFDTNTKVAYPYGIAQVVMFVRWLKYKSYELIEKFNKPYASAYAIGSAKGYAEGRADRRLEDIAEGRAFEFRTMNNHLEALYRRPLSHDALFLLERWRDSLNVNT